MDLENDHSPSSAVWAIAREQHGVVTRGQLAQLGIGVWGVRHRVERGRLHVVWPGVFAVGRPELSRLGRLMAAVLTCGPDSALSHWSAGELWGLGPQKPLIEVSVRTCRKRRREGVVVHRRDRLEKVDVGERFGVSLTTPARTLVDLAAISSRGRIEQMVNAADGSDLIDPEQLRDALDRFRGQRGVARLRAVLDRHTFRFTESALERRFLRLVERLGLPTPESQKAPGAFRVDFLWPKLGLIVEADSLRHHRTAAQQARDRRRDQTHAMAGMTTIRFSHGQLRFEPARCGATLRAVMQRLEAGAAPE